ncbi:MAG TPA: hypothetical protein VFW23_18435 [Tepidisphaeraceae bacterium]|nr:hypothetical protein [Tepidisphaeraceae bacterium]
MHAPRVFAPSNRILLSNAVLSVVLGLGLASTSQAAMPGASPASSVSDVQQVLKHDENGMSAMSAADKAIGKLETTEFQIRQVVDRLSSLTSQIKANNLAIAGLAKLQPTKSLDNLSKISGAAKGDGSNPWMAGEAAPVPSLALVQKNIDEIQQRIKDQQSKRADNEKQRADLLQQAQKLNQQSEAASGKDALDLYDQGAQLRKKAADLSGQIEDADSKIMLEQQDLQVAQAQQKELNGALTRLDEAVKQANAGWETIQKQAQAYTQISQAIAGTGGAAAPTTEPSGTTEMPTTISAGIARLTDLVKEASDLRSQADGNLTTAISEFDRAATGSRTISQQYSGYLTAHPQAAEQPAWQLMTMIFNVAQPSLDKGEAELRRAQLQSSAAYTLAAQQAMIKDLASALGDAKITVAGMPENPDKAYEGDLTQAKQLAREAFDNSDKDLSAATNGTGGSRSAPGSTFQSNVKVTRAIELYAQSLLLKSIGDTDNAGKALEQAKGIISEQQEVSVLLPAELTPPKEKEPAAGNGAPTTAPSGAEATGTGATTSPTPATEPSGGAPTTAPAGQ